MADSDTRPIYLQLRDKIAAAIIDGRFDEGDMLPSVRAFAAQEGANPLTVAKAYQQFQHDGQVEVRRGIGMFVAPGARVALLRQERQRFIGEEWPAIRDRIERLGIAMDDLLATN